MDAIHEENISSKGVLALEYRELIIGDGKMVLSVLLSEFGRILPLIPS